MTELAMAYLTLGNIDPFEMVTAAAQGGFGATAIRISGHAPGDDWPLDPTNPAQRARMKQVMGQHGIKLVNASTYRFGPERTLEDYEPILEICAELGIATITANSFAGERRQTTDLLACVAEAAQPFGIAIGIEFIPVSAIKTAADAAEISVATGRDNVGIVIDALHLWRSGGEVETVRGLPPARIFGVQLCDGPLASPGPDKLGEEMRAGRLLPGEGAFDLAGLMAALPEGIEIEIETPNSRYDGLAAADKAQLAFRAGQEFLAAHTR